MQVRDHRTAEDRHANLPIVSAAERPCTSRRRPWLPNVLAASGGAAVGSRSVAGPIRVDIDGLADLARTLTAIQHQLDGLGQDIGRYDVAIGAPKVKTQLAQVAGNWSLPARASTKNSASWRPWRRPLPRPTEPPSRRSPVAPAAPPGAG